MKFSSKAPIFMSLIMGYASAVRIHGTIYCDNYFEFWFNGELIAKDPLFFTPHQAVKVSFDWDGTSDKHYAIMCQDYATESGYEYTLKAEPNLGSGALLARFNDGTITNDDWKVYVQTHGPTNASIALGCSPTNLGPCEVVDNGEPAGWNQPGFNSDSWDDATTYTVDEAGWGIPPVGAYCGPATNPFTQEPLIIPRFPWRNPLAAIFRGTAYNWNDTVPTLEDPWTYDEDHEGIRVEGFHKGHECIRPRQAFHHSNAEFIWAGDLDRDNRLLFVLDIPAGASRPTSSITCRLPIFWRFC